MCPNFSYAALGALERQCAHLQFQEPRTKPWLFDALVTPTLLYEVETRGPSLNKANHCKDLKRSLVSMTACMITSKALVPHDIIGVEMGAAPIIIEALFRSVQDNWQKMETFIVGMLKCSNGSSHVA